MTGAYMKSTIEVAVCILLFFSLTACGAPLGKADKAPVQKTTVQVSPKTNTANGDCFLYDT